MIGSNYDGDDHVLVLDFVDPSQGKKIAIPK